MGSTRVSADTSVVRSAGKETAATADGWATIGSETKSALESAKGAIKDDPSGLGAAIESFAGTWVPTLTKMGEDVSNLGANATTSANKLDQNDANGANAQKPPHVRPINGPVPAV
jgi:hypothetical protein